MRGYDAWRTTPPDDSFPPGVEDVIGEVILMPDSEGIEQWDGTVIPEFGKITEYEDGTDGDEDGLHYYCVLTVVSLQDGSSDVTIPVSAVEDFTVPDEHKDAAKALDEAYELASKARGRKAQAEHLLRRAAVRRAAKAD